MSDRHRRWICQMVFIWACLAPTLGVLLCWMNRPSPRQVAMEWSLRLGLPVQIQRVSTPTPDLIVLQNVRLFHPEVGCLAMADRVAVRRIPKSSRGLARFIGGSIDGGPTAETGQISSGSDAGGTLWVVERMVVAEAGLDELAHQLHESLLRRAGQAGSGASPTLEIAIGSLEVLAGPVPEAESFPAEVGRLAARFADVLLRHSTMESESGAPPRSLAGQGGGGNDSQAFLEVTTRLLPPHRMRLSEAQTAADVGIPLWLRLQRNAAGPADPNADRESDRSFYTAWELATLDQPVPAAWLNLERWPQWLRDSRRTTLAGHLSGHFSDQDWWLEARHFECHELDLSDLQYMLTGLRSGTQGPARLLFRHLRLQGSPTAAPVWEAWDVEVAAREGVLDSDLVAQTAEAVPLEPSPHLLANPVRRASLNEGEAEVVRFRQLNLGIRWKDQQLFIRRLLDQQQSQPILLGYDQQEHLRWPDGDWQELPWQSTSVSWSPTNSVPGAAGQPEFPRLRSPSNPVGLSGDFVGEVPAAGRQLQSPLTPVLEGIPIFLHSPTIFWDEQDWNTALDRRVLPTGTENGRSIEDRNRAWREADRRIPTPLGWSSPYAGPLEESPLGALLPGESPLLVESQSQQEAPESPVLGPTREATGWSSGPGLERRDQQVHPLPPLR